MILCSDKLGSPVKSPAELEDSEIELGMADNQDRDNTGPVSKLQHRFCIVVWHFRTLFLKIRVYDCALLVEYAWVLFPAWRSLTTCLSLKRKLTDIQESRAWL